MIQSPLLKAYPVLPAEQHDEVPQQAGRVAVQQLLVPHAFQGLVLGELDDVSLVGLLPDNNRQASDSGEPALWSQKASWFQK